MSPPNPYKLLPDKAFWRRSVANRTKHDVDPVGIFNLQILEQTKVATAGSCFAQHIARHLRKSGYNYYVAENGHPLLSSEVKELNNFGTFSARYGNIYTARQLKQLAQRALGVFRPKEGAWRNAAGHILDPFRPTVQPGGFSTEAEMLADRAQHLNHVREMFANLDIFIFTLGLTECWRSKSDGAVFPLCPGVEGGEFSEESYEFYNQSVDDVVNDINDFMSMLKAMNPTAQVVLTVSPVPLMATAEPGSHVLDATMYSKAVLRVAAESIRKERSDVHYFPSFEIITGIFSRGSYFASDLRTVTEEGVSHVMRLFIAHAGGRTASPNALDEAISSASLTEQIAAAFVDVECDEIALDRPS